MPSERRGLVPFEVAVVLAAALVPLPVPRVVPLLVAASASRWLRGRSWGEVLRGEPLYPAVGAVAGLVALALALTVGTAMVERLTGGAVAWSSYPIVRGSATQLFAVAVVVGTSAIAAELVLRGWIVERVLELGRGGPVLAVLTGAFAEALLAGGGPSVRLGAGLFGAGLGGMYVAAGRGVLAPLAARLAFVLGALGLEALRLVG
jgi:hypothetical protein